MSIDKNLPDTNSSHSEPVSQSDSENTFNPKGSSSDLPGKAPKNSVARKQQWITDIIIIFLLLSGGCLLYHFNKQSMRIEQLKQQQEASTGQVGKKSY